MKQVLYIIPVMFYYFIESIISGIPIFFVWKFFFSEMFKFNMQYIHWVLIIWIIKVIFFDVFKFSAFLDKTTENNNNEPKQ